MKFVDTNIGKASWNVAPPAGAWVEIRIGLTLCPSDGVAPLAGAWIEISNRKRGRSLALVAPLAEGELKKVNLELLVSSNALM